MEPEKSTLDSETALHDAIRALLHDAASKGVDVRGAWDVTDDAGDRQFTVEITEVRR